VVECRIAACRAPAMLPAVPTGHIAERGPVIPASALTCAHCGDVIGVYEPLLLTGDGKVRVTSLAAERDVVLARNVHYHRACYAARERDASAGR